METVTNCTLLQDDLCLLTSVLTIGPSKPPPLISDTVTHILELVINVIGLYVTSLFGVIGNIINMIVYGKQGLKDSITVGFFALSLSDLVLVSMPLVTASCHVADFLLPDSTIDFPSIHYVSSGWMRNMTYSISCFITAFLSIERCCCIILPFKVKILFTRGKTAFIIAAAFVFHLAFIMTLPAAFQLRWWPDYNTSVAKNMTRIFRVTFFEEGEMIEVVNTTLMSLIVPTITQVIVTISCVVLIHGLRVSASFRNEAASKTKTTPHRHHHRPETSESPSSAIGQELGIGVIGVSETRKRDDAKQEAVYGNRKGGENHLTNRDARLVKTMVFLVSILSACNIPFLAATFAWRSIPEMNIGMPYENMLRVVFSFVYLLGNLNASSNVFVYYHTSSNFRQVYNSLWFRDGDKGDANSMKSCSRYISQTDIKKS